MRHIIFAVLSKNILDKAPFSLVHKQNNMKQTCKSDSELLINRSTKMNPKFPNLNVWIVVAYYHP